MARASARLDGRVSYSVIYLDFHVRSLPAAHVHETVNSISLSILPAPLLPLCSHVGIAQYVLPLTEYIVFLGIRKVKKSFRWQPLLLL